jgi:WD40 repeat protein
LVQIQVGASSNPYPLAFNPAGDILATGARGISLWQVESGQPIISFPVTGFVRSLQFLPDGATLVSSGTDGFVRVWDMATNTEKTQLQITGVGTPRLIDAVLQPDGKFLISVERDTDNLARWDGQAGSTPTFYQAQVGMVLQSSLSPDGDVVAVAGSQQVVALYNQLGTDPMAILDGFTAPVLGVEFGPNATEVYTSHEDGSLARWSAENGRFINKIMLRAGQQRPNTDSLLMTERYVIVRGFNTVLVYTLDLGIKRFELNATGNLTSAGTTTPTRFILNNDDSLLVVGSALNHIVIWELTNGSLVGQLRGHRAAITDIRFGAGDNFLLTASADGSARLWGLP